MSRESFLADLRTALGRNVAMRPGGQPAHADVLAYFRTLSGNPERALAVYQDYVQSFYIHAAHVPNDRSGGNVDWPGGSCDRWDELVARRRHQSQRIIDCEGYAFMGAQLLQAAGWRLQGYLVIYLLPTRTTPFDYHMMSVLQSPGAQTQAVYVGSDRPSNAWVTEAHRVWPQAHFSVRASTVEDTPDAAIAAVQQEVARQGERLAAPERLRRSVAPSMMEMTR